MKTASLDEYEYPGGTRWQKLFADGLFKWNEDARSTENEVDPVWLSFLMIIN